MTEEEIQILKDALRVRVVYVEFEGESDIVTEVAPPSNDEPSECALLADGGYIALDNTELECFVIKHMIDLREWASRRPVYAENKPVC